MKSLVVSALSGFVFAVGLAISGMTQPAKVTAFLDFFGNWDPSLAFVMGGAILVYLPLYKFSQKRDTPVFAGRVLVPTRRDIDMRLLGGAAVFGVGWGLAGYCPGPALTSLGSGALPAIVLVGSMFGGMALYRLVESWRNPRVTGPDTEAPPVAR
jgi:hypothetical protein